MIVIITGFRFLEREEFTPVVSTKSAAIFPWDSSIPLSRDKPTLVLFLHPLCPCSRATLRQLERLQGEIHDKTTVVIAFTLAKGLPADWEKEGLWESAHAMKGVQVVRDVEGVEARRFNVVGSGHALLYDAQGRLLFSGGITASRGHEGDNPGQDAIASLLQSGRANVAQTPVFGCSLL